MTNSSVLSLWFTRFNIRELVLLIVIVTFGYGWFSAEQRLDRERRLMETERKYLEAKLDRVKDELQDQVRGPRPDPWRSFWEAGLEGSNLVGMTLASRGNAFQRANFRKCNLKDAVLQGGVAAFQIARFDGADMIRCQLTGEASSFQRASFAAANLTEAILSGGSGSFQATTFENAVLIGARLSGDFQNSNLSGARFESADLSAITKESLASCYFKVPPTYDSRTTFPAGFDPDFHLWKLVKQPEPATD